MPKKKDDSESDDKSGTKFKIVLRAPLMPIHSMRYSISPRLGSAAFDTTPVSLTLSDDIFKTKSDNIKIIYPLTPTGPYINDDYLSPGPGYYNSNYNTIDDDSDVRLKITKYFYERLFNRWIYRDYRKILNLFKVKSGKVIRIKSKKEYKNNNLSDKDKDLIINHIIENYYDKYDLKHSLNSFTKKSRTRWVELIENKEYVKQKIYNDLKKKLRN